MAANHTKVDLFKLYYFNSVKSVLIQNCIENPQKQNKRTSLFDGFLLSQKSLFSTRTSCVSQSLVKTATATVTFFDSLIDSVSEKKDLS